MLSGTPWPHMQTAKSFPKRAGAPRQRLSSQGAAYDVALTPLPFPGWSLATVIPEAEFLGPVETTLRRLIVGLGAGALR